MNSAQRLGSVTAVVAVTGLSLAGIVLGAAFIADAVQSRNGGDLSDRFDRIFESQSFEDCIAAGDCDEAMEAMNEIEEDSEIYGDWDFDPDSFTDAEVLLNRGSHYVTCEVIEELGTESDDSSNSEETFTIRCPDFPADEAWSKESYNYDYFLEENPLDELDELFGKFESNEFDWEKSDEDSEGRSFRRYWIEGPFSIKPEDFRDDSDSEYGFRRDGDEEQFYFEDDFDGLFDKEMWSDWIDEGEWNADEWSFRDEDELGDHDFAYSWTEGPFTFMYRSHGEDGDETFRFFGNDEKFDRFEYDGESFNFGPFWVSPDESEDGDSWYHGYDEADVEEFLNGLFGGEDGYAFEGLSPEQEEQIREVIDQLLRRFGIDGLPATEE